MLEVMMTSFAMYLGILVYGVVILFFLIMTYRLVKAVEKIADLLESK
jgi:hypothetical protein